MLQPMEKELLTWLSRLENRHTQEIQLGLDRVRKVASFLDLLHPDAVVITVAGTNGKGSTVALLESIYHTAGYCVATYTSPHLLSFTERIRLNQQAISPARLVEVFEQVELARGTTHLTYFEVATLAALCYFKDQKPDVIILEVGLGGRLDATNIIDSDLAIITTIDFDHQDFLGNTKDAIGYEKAGILRKGQYFICADTHPPKSVLDKAEAMATRTCMNGRDYDYRHGKTDGMFYHGNQTLMIPQSTCHPHAVSSAVMATLCLESKLPLSHEHLRQGVAEARLAGRVQLLNCPHPTILDVAHNPQAARYLAGHLKKHFPGRKIHAVFSALADKDISGIVAPLLSCVSTWYPAQLSGKRAASPERLLQALIANEVEVSLCYNDPVLAYQAACQRATTDDLILVYGSFLTVGAVLEHPGCLQSYDIS